MNKDIFLSFNSEDCCMYILELLYLTYLKWSDVTYENF